LPIMSAGGASVLWDLLGVASYIYRVEFRYA
jgi:hypothetical protein